MRVFRWLPTAACLAALACAAGGCDDDATEEAGDATVDAGDVLDEWQPSEGLTPYLLLDDDAVAHLRGVFDAERTRPCEIQVVGDSISESYLFLNPLTFDPSRPDMAYGEPTHCRIFGQPSIFLDVPQTAATGRTAAWGLEGHGDWGGVRNLRYPMTYQDRDPARAPIGMERAWPEVATILFGTNDVRLYVQDAGELDPQGEAAARAKYREYLRGIAQWFLDRGVVPVLVTMPPGEYPEYDARIGDGPPLGELWAEEVRDLGRELRVPVFDLNRLLLDEPDWPSLFSDGVHPDEEGYARINAAFYDVYRDLRRVVLTR